VRGESEAAFYPNGRVMAKPSCVKREETLRVANEEIRGCGQPSHEVCEDDICNADICHARSPRDARRQFHRAGAAAVPPICRFGLPLLHVFAVERRNARGHRL